ncbi:hypothetical protein AB0J21_10670 [Streptomyces sp. NPDC049954]|uniref:hypothetical protein n=1 Tax=Streptomyces sp. NPDC049954 TaxID=3155779 RepID=UPI003438409F
MRIHRSRHARGFTVLPNLLLQDRRLSYTARGLLVDLLSRPENWSEDGRHMADSSPQGRIAVARGLRELASLGYYWVNKIRRPDGTFVTEVHVYDVPRAAPGADVPDTGFPGPGELKAGAPGAHPVKNGGKKPSLPAQRTSALAPVPVVPAREPVSASAPGLASASEASVSEAYDGSGRGSGQEERPHGDSVARAASTLCSVVRTEPRLRIGAVEALSLAPLVHEWLERGYGERDLAAALLGGLPTRLHSAVALLRDRLTRKLPPAPEPPEPARAPELPKSAYASDPPKSAYVSGPPESARASGPDRRQLVDRPRWSGLAGRPWWSECEGCGRPVREQGPCASCAAVTEEERAARARATDTVTRGRALVRAALEQRAAGTGSVRR